MAEFPRSPEGDPDYLAAISQVDPFLIAAMRQRQGVQPMAGRQEGETPIEYALPARAADPFGIPSALTGMVSPEARDAWRGEYEGNKLGSALGQFATPGGVTGLPAKALGYAVKTAPKLTGATLGAILGMQSTEAETGQLSDADVRRQREMARIQRQRMQDQSKSARDAADLERIRGENEQRARQEAFDQQQRMAEESRLAQEAEAKRKREQPLRERFPELAAGLPLATPIAGAVSGAVAGRMGRSAGASKFGTMAGAGLAGGAEGAIMNTLPTEYDAASLPLGSENQKRAAGDLADPNFWATRIAPATGIGAASAMIGAKYGYGVPRKPGPVSGTGSPAETPSLPLSTGTAGQTAKDYTSPLIPYLDDAGRWRDPMGRFSRSPE